MTQQTDLLSDSLSRRDLPLEVWRCLAISLLRRTEKLERGIGAAIQRELYGLESAVYLSKLSSRAHEWDRGQATSWHCEECEARRVQFEKSDKIINEHLAVELKRTSEAVTNISGDRRAWAKWPWRIPRRLLGGAYVYLNAFIGYWRGEVKAHGVRATCDAMLVQHAIYIQDERADASKFYASLLTVLLAVILLIVEKGTAPDLQRVTFLTIGILGLVLCFVWSVNIHSYKQLNSLKFKVVHEMEQKLPFPCYKREWQILEQEKSTRSYLRLSQVEQYVPLVLMVPYLILVIYALMR